MPKLVALVLGVLLAPTLFGIWVLGGDQSEHAAAKRSQEAGTAASQSSGTTPKGPLNEVPSPLDGEGGPCTLSKRLPDRRPLANTSSVPHWAPHSQYASSESRTAAWSCIAGVVVFEYDSGVRLYLEPEWGTVFDNPGKAWAAQARADGRGRVVPVRGQPALLQGPTDKRLEVGQVRVIDQQTGTLIRVLGNGKLPADALAKIAASVR